MDKETESRIRRWEAERDRNLRIKCPYVAAKFQRWIDKELEKQQCRDDNENGIKTDSHGHKNGKSWTGMR